jgi:GMP synthase-like glutamine amidotransferase
MNSFKLIAMPLLPLYASINYWQVKEVVVLKLEPGLPYDDFLDQYLAFLERPSPFYSVKFNASVIDVTQEQGYDLSDYDAFLLTGGRGDINARPDLEPLKNQLKDFLNIKPMIGFCLGFQLLAKMFGGGVEEHPSGLIMAIDEHKITSKKEWMSPYQTKVNVYMAHSFYAKTLGNGSECLFSNNSTTNAGAQFNKTVIGIQGHPEVRPDKLKDRLSGFQSLAERGVARSDINASIKSILTKKDDHEVVRIWLRNFLANLLIQSEFN